MMGRVFNCPRLTSHTSASQGLPFAFRQWTAHHLPVAVPDFQPGQE